MQRTIPREPGVKPRTAWAVLAIGMALALGPAGCGSAAPVPVVERGKPATLKRGAPAEKTAARAPSGRVPAPAMRRVPRAAPRDRPQGATSPRPERTPAPASAVVARPKPAAQPKPAVQSAAQSAAKSAAKSAQPGRYVVQAGDTLYSIAWRHRMDHRTLGKANGVPAPYLIHPGQQLTVQPGARAARLPAKPTRGGKLRWRWPVRSGINAKAASPPPGSLGIKLTLPVGTPVRASVGGTVVYAGNGLPGYGNLLIIKHDADWLSAYGHNQRLLAQEGQTVGGGDPVALSGRDADGKPGLYFEIRRRGEQMDVRRLLPKR